MGARYRWWDPDKLRSVHGRPEYAAVTAQLERRLAELRRELDVPEHDPVPYLPSDVQPQWRRPNPPPDVVPAPAAHSYH